VLPVMNEPVIQPSPCPIQTTPARKSSAPTTRLRIVTEAKLTDACRRL
jgi:hypothetical protein